MGDAAPRPRRQGNWSSDVISWRMRWANLNAAILTATTGRHHYLSTSCLDNDHAHCRSATRLDGGAKVPGTCKTCAAVCCCPRCRHQPSNRGCVGGSSGIGNGVTRSAAQAGQHAPWPVSSRLERATSEGWSRVPVRLWRGPRWRGTYRQYA